MRAYFVIPVLASILILGTFATGTVVFANFDQCANDPAQGKNKGVPFLEIWAAICDLQNQIDAVGSGDTTALQNQVDELSNRIDFLENSVGVASNCLRTGFNVDLHVCDLSGASLISVDLRGADLRFANLSGADLRFARLVGANLSGANLIGADLGSADLRFVNFSDTDLSGADLSGALLLAADFNGSNLQDALGAPFVGCINHPSCV